MAGNNESNFENLELVFNDATNYVKYNISKLSSKQLLEFYGFYKQATEGCCTKPKPSWYELSEKQKWEAWSSLKDMNSEVAMEKYIELLNTVEPEWQSKTVETPNKWVHHSCMKNNDDFIEDSKKNIFDWVKEKNIEKVITHGLKVMPEVDLLDDSGLGLLHWAADRGSLEIVKYLIDNLKANVNLRDINGQTPLHYAVSCEYDDVASYLIEAGADVDLKDNDGFSPYGSCDN